MESFFDYIINIFIEKQIFLINLSLALTIGIIIGLERQKHKKVIGVRTASLIMIGSFTFAYVSLVSGGDPSRVISQIVTGVGFIGGGIIFKNGVDDIRHLTTAVLVWTLAAIGSLIALSKREEAIIITIVILLFLKITKFFLKEESGKEC